MHRVQVFTVLERRNLLYSITIFYFAQFSAVKSELSPGVLFCFSKKWSGVRMLTTFYLVKNDHRWVTYISLKTIHWNHVSSLFYTVFGSDRIGHCKGLRGQVCQE